MPSLGFKPILLQGNVPTPEICIWLFSNDPEDLSQPSCTSTLPTNLDVVSSVSPWLYSFSPACLHLVIQDDFLNYLVVISIWSGKEVSVASTYSAAILDLFDSVLDDYVFRNLYFSYSLSNLLAYSCSKYFLTTLCISWSQLLLLFFHF